jgi:hypothetical protein
MKADSSEKLRKFASSPLSRKAFRSDFAVQSSGSETTIPKRMTHDGIGGISLFLPLAKTAYQCEKGVAGNSPRFLNVSF